MMYHYTMSPGALLTRSLSRILIHSPMHRSTKITLWITALVLASPFLCCGSLFAYWNIVAPTVCRYRSESAQGTPKHEDSIRSIRFMTRMDGPNDFNESYHLERGPRYAEFWAIRVAGVESPSVTLIDISVTSSRLGQIEPCTPNTLPVPMVFEARNPKHGPGNEYAIWQGDLLLDTDPHAGDIITMTITVEISDNTQTTRHTLTYIHTPNCHEEPYWWMPSV